MVEDQLGRSEGKNFLMIVTGRQLVFMCCVQRGIGCHANLKIPGRHELRDAPGDWPRHLCPGSLNCLIRDDGYPADFERLGKAEGIAKFDEGLFAPEFVIPQASIGNNTLEPTSILPKKGTAQVWRAVLRAVISGKEERCWMLRRIGSSIKRQVELVSSVRLRDVLALNDGDPVAVTITEGRKSIPRG